MRILFATPNFDDQEQFKGLLADHSLSFAQTGIDAQVLLSKDKYDFIVIDSSLERHSFAFVLKFCKQQSPSTSIILYFSSSELLDELDTSKEEIRNLGIKAAVYGPDHRGKVSQVIKNNTGLMSWQEKVADVKSEHGQHKISDKLFTKLEVSAFHPGNTAIFDIYLRLGKDKYLKFVNKGEIANQQRIQSYINEHNVNFFYFKTEDRLNYVNYINYLLEKTSAKSNQAKRSALLSGATEKLLEEIYTKGLDEKIYNEGIKLCENAYKLLKSSEQTRDILLQIPPEALSHNYLTLIFANTICENLEWTGKTSIKNISTACLIHDIGLVKFKWFRDQPRIAEDQLSKKQKEEYLTHPSLGYDMLVSNSLITEATRQIVLQHHEYNNGTGFPTGLSSQQIYPLAKIVSLADFFSHIIIDNKISPIDALRKFIPDKQSTDKFSPENIKALIKGFVKNE